MRSREAPLLLTEPERISRVRDVFGSAGLNLERLLDVCDEKVSEHISYDRRQIPRLLRRCPEGEPIGVLFRLFLVGVPVAEADAKRILGTGVIEDLQAVGLLGTTADGRFIGHFRVSPVEDRLLVVSEVPWTPTPPPRELQVMAISGSTRGLARLAIPPTGGSVLEIGTGCGVVAMLAARRADRVLATDFNFRAVNLATFSARLNGLNHLEVRQGDLFEPVGDEQFDRIVTNPPYVMNPPTDHVTPRLLYRDSGYMADGLSEAVVRGMGRHLKPGGFAQSAINWACITGADWKARLHDWVKDSGCDAWLLRSDILPAERYITRWMPNGSEGDFPAYQQRFNDWLKYFERERIEAVGSGLITLRKRDGLNWFAEDAVPEPHGECGPAVRQGFALRDFLLSRNDEGLLAATYRLATDARWEQVLEPAVKGWAMSQSRLKLSTGLGFTLTVDALGMQVVTRCRGDRPLGAALAEMAVELKQDPGKLAAAALPFIRVLIEQGFLSPIEPGGK